MPLKDVFKVNRKTFINPTGWLGYDSLKSQFKTSWQVIKDLYSPPPAGTPETFDEAQQRFNLSNEQIEHISKTFLSYTFLFVGCGSATILFSIYLLFGYGTLSGFILGIATAAVFFAFAFRYSFLRFQIKHRKLGCTFQEWLRGKPSNEGTHHGV